MKRSWLAAGAVVALYLLLGWLLGRGAGLTRTIAVDEGRDELSVQRVADLGLEDVAADTLARPGVTVTWRGVWRVPASGLFELAMEATGRSSWRIDGYVAQQVTEAGDSGTRRAVWLASGFHALEIAYAPENGSRFTAAVARPGAVLEPLDPRALKPRAPRNPTLHRIGEGCRRGAFWIGLCLVALAMRRTVQAMWPSIVPRWWPPAHGDRLGRAVAWTALAIVMTHGALLRVDAITARFGVVTSPSWVAAVQTRTIAPPKSMRPASMRWDRAPVVPHADGPPTRYLSDPYTYLQAARQNLSFYGAHYREPVFPHATRIALALFNDQDVAVSFASTAFSVLAIWLTYILGAAVWSRPVGLLAALGFALDYDAITLASLGWRDDAYVAAVALGAYLMLRCKRAGGRSDPRPVRIGPWQVDAVYLEAVALGLAAGLIVLVRIMAVSFLAAGAAWLLMTMGTRWRRRLTMAGLAVGAAMLVAGPYFVNCWRVYGDPLYTFNVHGDVYRVAEGGEATHEDTVSYILGKASARPFQMIDTVASGLTSYPFSNKWSGLNHWWRRAGVWASLVALVGLAVLAATPQGRLLLVVMVTSLVPFAFTWKVDPNWRFTVHVYPFLLIAAAVGVSSALSITRALVMPRRDRQPRASSSVPRASWPVGLAAVVVALVGAWLIGRALPARAFAESLGRGEDGTVAVGPGDAAFLGRGWSEVLGEYPVRLRVATGEAAIVIPLPAVADYPITLRVDPFPTPLPTPLPHTTARLPMVDVEVNGASIGPVTLEWTPGRVGAYRLVIPRAVAQRGDNHLVLRVRGIGANGTPAGRHPGLADGDAFSLWLLRVHPAQ